MQYALSYNSEEHYELQFLIYKNDSYNAGFSSNLLIVLYLLTLTLCVENMSRYPIKPDSEIPFHLTGYYPTVDYIFYFLNDLFVKQVSNTECYDIVQTYYSRWNLFLILIYNFLIHSLLPIIILVI